MIKDDYTLSDDACTDLYTEELSPYEKPAIPKSVYSVKRAIDVTFALPGAILGLVPVTLGAAAVAVEGLLKDGKLHPSFYIQERPGRDGEVFKMLKLRTMDPETPEINHMNEDTDLLHRTYQKQNNPRVTPVGRLLRKMGIDEIPQLYNVLKGDMSLVGPRPRNRRDVKELAEHGIIYEFDNCEYGLTGPEQIARHKYDEVFSHPEMEYGEKLKAVIDLNVEYNDNFGPTWYRQVLKDLGIIFKTPYVLLTGKHC